VCSYLTYLFRPVDVAALLITFALLKGLCFIVRFLFVNSWPQFQVGYICSSDLSDDDDEKEIDVKIKPAKLRQKMAIQVRQLRSFTL